uniref:galactose-specific lectin nattectin-like n=1 Tax=Doryrhamphus excisus TaxID=161450 RepID=UPI0025AE996C|nr:galactose-specific lectin nattectin-like [Doryrhamphus excisus]XP_057907145.1 galactose-specific lectin nattectin-like [Doryrhamphus excisus]XP_057907146.1 galactose-specific lectin nattectin-like [Doryrhamphus excisus]XP_057907147.1 galactose-specific lectin nattectin-like [Doryrhamphus excisus]XP_057907149.1 galactose-specific lectin nattectin-like [Doryrhamphus excisus]
MAFALRVLFLLCGISGVATVAWSDSYYDAGCCPKGWAQLDNYCFIFKREATTFEKAEHDCQKHGGNLVSIHSSLESLFVLGLLEQVPAEFAWIGLHDPAEDGDFRWTDNTNFDFDKFSYGQPSDHGSCVVIYVAGEWFVKPCTLEKPYVCIKDTSCCANRETA